MLRLCQSARMGGGGVGGGMAAGPGMLGGGDDISIDISVSHVTVQRPDDGA